MYTRNMTPQEISIVDERDMPIELGERFGPHRDVPIELVSLMWFRKYTTNGESVVQVQLKVRRLPNAPIQGN